MDSCLFCKIVAGQIPSFKVYEDDGYLSFMDINPVSKGHVLVIPKRHCVNLFDLDPALASGYLAVVQKVAQRVCARLGASDFNLVMANGKNAQQSVYHAHIHIVPRWEKDGLDLFFHGRAKPGMEELAALHKTLL